MTKHFSHLTEEEEKRLWPDGTILLGYRGSISHNMFVPQHKEGIDDKDIMGVMIYPASHYIGLCNKKEAYEVKLNEWDGVYYELKKFVYLLLKSNPNVLGFLWMEEKNYIHVSPAGRRLIEIREAFLSKAVHKSFTGYAYSQMTKMTAGKKYQGYMGTKRRELVDKFGYDTKNACHMIRLLRMGIECLTEGRLIVERPDAKELLAIKRGEWSLAKVQEEADHLFRLSREAYVNTKLPDKPNREKIEKVLMDILEDHHWPEMSARCN